MTTANIFTRPQITQRRVVVTGMATMNAVGSSLGASWDGLVAGRSGIAPITLFDASAYDTKFAGEVKGFDPDPYVNKKDQKKMDRFIHFAMATTKEALLDAGLEWPDDRAQRVGTIIGVGIGGLPIIEKTVETILSRGPSRISPFFIPAVISNLASGQVSMAFNAKGANYCVTSACASGAHSIGEAARHIRDGVADVMIAGGSEAVVCPSAIGGFGAMKALSTRNDNPAAASRPWDRDRDGFVLGEGCGMLILEDYEHASKRGARIYAEVTGYGMSSDAYHMTSPSPGGQGAALAMGLALKDARLNAEQVGYINAHGTSTPVGDEIETEAIKRVFGDHAKKLMVSSTKSMTGHTLGAAGAIESVFSIMALHKGVIPPTINLTHPSPDCDLDYVPVTARERKVDHVLNNSFGFGGTNASLIFSKV
ncbi:MAG: beta-ketoacyl-ACP synthase II [Bdellovibrionales bacterium]